MLISAIPPTKRDQVLSQARRDAAKHSEALIPFHELIPSGASWETKVDFVNGSFASLLALSTASKSATVGQVMKTAAAFTSGQPMSGHPSEFQDAGCVPLAKTLMAASLTSPEFAEELISQPQLLEDIKKSVYLLESEHPLSGAPMAGNFWTKIGNIAKSVSDAILAPEEAAATIVKDPELITAATNIASVEAQDEIQRVLADSGAQQSDIEKIIDLVMDRLANDQEADTEAGSTDKVKQSAADAIAAITAELAARQQDLGDAKQIERELARVQWAASALQAPDQVAEMMTRVQPAFDSPEKALKSTWSFITAARDSGDMTTLSSLVSVVKGALSPAVNAQIPGLAGDALAAARALPSVGSVMQGSVVQIDPAIAGEEQLPIDSDDIALLDQIINRGGNVPIEGDPILPARTEHLGHQYTDADFLADYTGTKGDMVRR